MTSKNGSESSVKKRVLLVDDEARVRASLKAVLEPVYEVIQAADAQEGLDLFHKEAPHLVLLDVILPGTDGLSVLQALRTEQNPTPVIMLTGTKSVKTAVDAMKLGAADYLSKPFDVEELRIVVNRALNAASARSTRERHVTVTHLWNSDAMAVEFDPAERSEIRHRFQTALAALPHQQRMIVELSDIDGRSSTEIGEMLNLPRGTVRWHLHQARKTLRTALASLFERAT